MAVNTSAMIGVSVSSTETQSGGSAGEEVTVTSSEATAVNVAIGQADEGESSDLQVTLGGEGTAVGEDTYAEGVIAISASGDGGATVASGWASFIAIGQSSDDGGAYAVADSFAIADGADILVTTAHESSLVVESGDVTLWEEASSTTILAVALPDASVDEADPEATAGEDAGVAAPVPLIDEGGAGDGSYEDEFDGNLAFLAVDAVVIGDDSHVGVDAAVLTVEDQLSTVTAVVVTEIG